MARKKRNVPEPQNYYVEKILDCHIDENNDKWYYLKWKGFPDDQSTWEPCKNLDCTKLIAEFEKSHNARIQPRPAVTPESDIQWSLKHNSSTKIVLRKVITSSPHSSMGDNYTASPVPSPSYCSMPDNAIPPQHYSTSRISKRRRSSTIGKQVSASKKKKALDTPTKNSVEPVELEEYTVEKIVDKCQSATGRILYLIKWNGWDSIHNTWEPDENLNCASLLFEFNQKNRTPKFIVNKIIDKRNAGRDQWEYLVKVAGCRKDKWIMEENLQCSDLLIEFNELYDQRNSKTVSVEDIADNCSDASSSCDEEVMLPEPVAHKGPGIKMNHDCVTSSDDEEALPVRNGVISSPIRSSSSSDADFDELLRATDNISEDEEMIPTVTAASPSLIVNEGNNESPKSDPRQSPKSEPPQHLSKSSSSDSESEPETPRITPQQASQNHLSKLREFLKASKPTFNSTVKSPTVALNGYYETVPNIVPPPPKLKNHSVPNRRSPTLLKSEKSPSPKPDLSKITQTFIPNITSPIHPDPGMNPDYSSQGDNTNDSQSSDNSLSSMEEDLTNALAGILEEELSDAPLQPRCNINKSDPFSTQQSPPKSSPKSLPDITTPSQDTQYLQLPVKSESKFSSLGNVLDTKDPVEGVDLSALMLQSAEKGDESHSELFAAIADQPAQLEDHVAFHDPEPIAAPSPNTLPSEAEIDCVLGEIYDNTMIKSLPPVKNVPETADTVLGDIYNDTLNSAMKSEPEVIKSTRKVKSWKSSKVWCDDDDGDSWHEADHESNTMFSTFLSPQKKGKRKKSVAPVKDENVDDIQYDSKNDMFSGFSSVIKKKNYKKTASKQGKKKFACHHCTRTFKDKSKLDYHTNFTHPESMGFACDMCRESFESAIELQCHHLACGQEYE